MVFLLFHQTKQVSLKFDEKIGLTKNFKQKIGVFEPYFEIIFGYFDAVNKSLIFASVSVVLFCPGGGS